MEKQGIVVDLQGNKAKVEIKRMTECGDKCTTCAGGCNTPSIVVEVENKLNARRGDYVILEAPEFSVMKSTFVLYTIPLIDFVIGVFIGLKLFSKFLPLDAELTGVLTGLVFLGASYVAIAFLRRKSDEILKMQSVLKKL